MYAEASRVGSILEKPLIYPCLLVFRSLLNCHHYFEEVGGVAIDLNTLCVRFLFLGI